MGPYNAHFIRDVSFAFLVSCGAFIHGAHHHKRDIALIGAAWPFLNALFHIYTWFHRGLPFDTIWLVDLIAVIIPGMVVLWLAYKIEPAK